MSAVIIELFPSFKIAVTCYSGASAAGFGFDTVPIFFVSAKVADGEFRVYTFLAHIDAPVDAVEKEVIITAACVGSSSCFLAVTSEDFAYGSISRGIFTMPGMVLFCTQIEFVKFRDSFFTKERKYKRALAVLATEEKPERVLRIIGGTTGSAANAQTGIDLKLFSTLRINVFN